MAKIIYNTQTHEVYNSFPRAEKCEDGIVRGFFGESDEFWAGYDPSCNPEIHELTKAEEKVFDPTKIYTYDGNTLAEVEPPADPVEDRLDKVESQTFYTAMMTDTLMEEMEG